MTYRIWKVFTIGAYEKEEKWLNKMAAKGLNLVTTNGVVYTFEDGIPGEYTYRLEMLEKMPTHIESVRYIKFLEETGVEYVTSFRKWVYLRKKKSDEPFEIYSDIKSKLNHYNRIVVLAWIISIVPTFQLLTNLLHYFETSFNKDVHLYIALLMLGCLLFVHGIMIPVYKSIIRLKNEAKIFDNQS